MGTKNLQDLRGVRPFPGPIDQFMSIYRKYLHGDERSLFSGSAKRNGAPAESRRVRRLKTWASDEATTPEDRVSCAIAFIWREYKDADFLRVRDMRRRIKKLHRILKDKP